MFVNYIYYFIIYSFMGWICETVYCSVLDKKFVNRGFLNGPVCPVYGFGALLVISLLQWTCNNLVVLFFSAILLTSTLEYITGLILEISFKTKWWDYSENKFNIKGRVCLLNSTLFGLLSVFLIKVVHVNVVNFINLFTERVKIVVLLIIGIGFIVDLTLTLITVLNIESKLKAYIEAERDYSRLNLGRLKFDENGLVSLFRKVEDEISEEHIKESLENIYIKLNNIKNKSLMQRRLFKAFPKMKHNINHEHFAELIKLIKEKKYKER